MYILKNCQKFPEWPHRFAFPSVMNEGSCSSTPFPASMIQCSVFWSWNGYTGTRDLHGTQNVHFSHIQYNSRNKDVAHSENATISSEIDFPCASEYRWCPALQKSGNLSKSNANTWSQPFMASFMWTEFFFILLFSVIMFSLDSNFHINFHT